VNPHYSRVAERAEHRCEYCRAPEAIFNFAFEVEHIVPPGLGGTDDEANQALSCRCCNVFKSNQHAVPDPQTGIITPLFNPREQGWEAHFGVDQANGTLIGLTPTGRATIDALQMNRPTQIIARKHWMRLKLYP
jgi:HNH endonuclease